MKQALICVSFGTTVPSARQEIEAVEQALSAAAPERVMVRAFTSGMIRRVLAGRGQPVPSLPEALESLRRDGVEDVFVQPTHFLCGVEYDKLRAEALSAASGFARLRVGRPLLASTEDLRAVAAMVADRFPAETGRAVVLMGHGSTHFANVVYPAIQTIFELAGRPDIRVGTVESWPTLEEVRETLRSMKVERVHLAPLMLVAGDHALNDMAGESPDSWKTLLEQDGYAVTATLEGLGRREEIQALYAAHLTQDLN